MAVPTQVYGMQKLDHPRTPGSAEHFHGRYHDACQLMNRVLSAWASFATGRLYGYLIALTSFCSSGWLYYNI
jgi:hypothetical protein